MSSSESKDNGDATMQDEQQQQQRTEQQSEGGASPAPSAAAAAAATPAASDAAASENGSAAAAAAAASGASASTKKGKSKGKKEEVLEVDPNFEGQRFKVGELIFANYAEGKQWFEAKVLKVEKRGGQIYYYLHYQGWSDKFHDWRPYNNDAELHKHDEAGKRLMEEAKQRMKEAKKGGGKGGAAAAAATADEGKSGKKGSKRKLGDDDDTLSDEVSVGGAGASEVRLRIPGYLKKQLIADWEAVTRNHRLVTLPRPMSVKALLREFEESKQKQESSHLMVKEIRSGLEQYFEKALGTVLLYRFERPQFKAQQAAAATEGKTLGDIYGAEHLLRLFVKLPSLLSYTKLEPREAIVLASKLNDFIKWLDKKAQGGQLFQAEYEATEQEYMQKVTAEADA